MKVTDLPIQGLKLIELKIFNDSRGFFVERYNEKTFREAGLPVNFVQDNHSRSTPGVSVGCTFRAIPHKANSSAP